MVFCLPILQGIALNATAFCLLCEVNKLRLDPDEKDKEDSLAIKLHIHWFHIDHRDHKHNPRYP